MTIVASEQRVSVSIPVANLEQIADVDAVFDEFIDVDACGYGFGQRDAEGVVKLGNRSPIRWGLDLALQLAKVTGYTPEIHVILEGEVTE